MAVKRQYGQFCGLASALDIVGDRWTLLIIRELLISPARFSEIMENLPGIGPNLLSDRLRTLGQTGVIEHSPVPVDGRGKQYRLTQVGEQLRTPLLSLARWGMRFLDEPGGTETSRAAWGFLAVQAMIYDRRAPEVDESYEFVVDDEVFHIEVRDGHARAARGAVPDAALTITTSADTFIRIGAQLLTPFDALATGALRMEGDRAAVQRCSRLMGLSPGSLG